MSPSGTDERLVRGMRAQLARRGERLAAGERPLGWKVGFGTPAAMEQLGTSAPLVGYLLESGRLESGADCSLAGWTKPMLEPELAVHLGADVPAGADADAVRAAIAGLGAAIELADVHPPPTDPEAILAANIFQRHVVLGPVDSTRDGGTDGITARVLVDDDEVAATDDPIALTGDPVALVAHVAATLAASGEQLRAGDVIITGSITPPLAVAAGDAVTVELPPLGTLRVSFSS